MTEEKKGGVRNDERKGGGVRNDGRKKDGVRNDGGGGEGGLFVIAGSVARHDAASCFGFIIKFSKILKNMRQTLDSLGC